MKQLKVYAVCVTASLVALNPAFAEVPSGYCEVIVCNKLERFTLSPWSAVKDKMGEQCFGTVLEKSEAVPGKILDSSTRWYHGSFNPTKKSVTRVKKVLTCKV